jgi:NAD(P)-dependent dehydrogenase (short-subunit alcohol dehydrogenase family)
MSQRPSIFITGAAAGIGRATAERFARGGWYVGLYDVNAAGVQELRRQLGEANASAGALDVTDAARFGQALAEFWEAAGRRLDVLFNNAGIAAVDDFDRIPLARHHAVIDVNLKGVVNGCHAAFPYLRQTPGARVISMASMSAVYGTPNFACYSATKFAVKGLTEALDIEWRRYGIVVRDVLPSYVDTPMVRHFEQRPKSMDVLGLRLRAEDVARTVWRAAHWPRWYPRVHWYIGLQGWFFALAQKLSPGWVNRLTTKLVTGY